MNKARAAGPCARESEKTRALQQVFNFCRAKLRRNSEAFFEELWEKRRAEPENWGKGKRVEISLPIIGRRPHFTSARIVFHVNDGWFHIEELYVHPGLRHGLYSGSNLVEKIEDYARQAGSNYITVVSGSPDGIHSYNFWKTKGFNPLPGLSPQALADFEARGGSLKLVKFLTPDGPAFFAGLERKTRKGVERKVA